MVRRAFLLVCIAGCASAQPQPVTVTQAWARATAPSQTEGAVYATLTSPTGDRLVGVSSPDATDAMVHRTVRQEGMTSMEGIDGVTLPPGQPVRLAPRGLHVMLSRLRHPLIAGSHVSLVFHFEHAGQVPTDVPVLPIGSAGP